MKITRACAVICLAVIIAGCGAKTPSEVVKAWAGAHKSADIEDVMYYSLQDQIKPRIDLKNEIQCAREEQSLKIHKDYWSDIKLGVQYNIINSYEKMFNGSSKHFFLIQESMNSAAPLIEVPLDNNFTYSNFTGGQVLNS